MTRNHARRVPSRELARLAEAWLYRDERYRGRSMSEQEEAAVRAFRRAEADGLPPDERLDALSLLARWSPPRGVRTARRQASVARVA